MFRIQLKSLEGKGFSAGGSISWHDRLNSESKELMTSIIAEFTMLHVL